MAGRVIMEHTPWRSIHGEIVDARGVVVADMSYDPELAAGIVSACNAHGELVKALLAVYQDVDLQSVEGGSDELNLLVQAAPSPSEGRVMDTRTWLICWDIFGSYFGLAGRIPLVQEVARKEGYNESNH